MGRLCYICIFKKSLYIISIFACMKTWIATYITTNDIVNPSEVVPILAIISSEMNEGCYGWICVWFQHSIIAILLFSEVKLLPFKTMIFKISKFAPVDTKVGFVKFKNIFIPFDVQSIRLIVKSKKL